MKTKKTELNCWVFLCFFLKKYLNLENKLNDNEVKIFIFFDGYCNLCSWAVRFIIKRDTKDYFRFSSLQSEAGKNIIESLNLSDTYKQSVILVENNLVYLKSEAALRILKKLKHLFSSASVSHLPASLPGKKALPAP